MVHECDAKENSLSLSTERISLPNAHGRKVRVGSREKWLHFQFEKARAHPLGEAT